MMLKNNQKKFSQEEVNEKRAKQKKKFQLQTRDLQLLEKSQFSFFFILMNALETNSSA